MIRVVFYCDIFSAETGEKVEEDFAFDEGEFANQDKLDEYIKNRGYEIGEIFGYWGDDAGVLTDILIY